MRKIQKLIVLTCVLPKKNCGFLTTTASKKVYHVHKVYATASVLSIKSERSGALLANILLLSKHGQARINVQFLIKFLNYA